MTESPFPRWSLTPLAVLATGRGVLAGMPAPLPSNWTAEETPGWASHLADPAGGGSFERWEAVSFFAVALVLCAWGVQGLWGTLRRDWPGLPPLRFGRALSLVVLWGLAFVLVLTMISGARELMTPGAWRKQGWTYRLAAEAPPADRGDEARTRALEGIRQTLWHHAATHDGAFPPADDAGLREGIATIPGRPGLTWTYLADRRAESQGRPLVYEPGLEGEERLVLLTNGLIGRMRSAELRQALGGEASR